MDAKSLLESDICARFITPALAWANWDEAVQIRREVTSRFLGVMATELSGKVG